MGSNGGASQSERVGQSVACGCGHPAFNHYPSRHEIMTDVPSIPDRPSTADIPAAVDRGTSLEVEGTGP